jgi:hypothetical protein
VKGERRVRVSRVRMAISHSSASGGCFPTSSDPSSAPSSSGPSSGGPLGLAGAHSLSLVWLLALSLVWRWRSLTRLLAPILLALSLAVTPPSPPCLVGLFPLVWLALFPSSCWSLFLSLVGLFSTIWLLI